MPEVSALVVVLAVITVAAGLSMLAFGCSNGDDRQLDSDGTKKSHPTLGEQETADAPQAPAGGTVVVIDTSMGAVTAELWDDKAPQTVANFLRYTDEGFYDGLIFHRVIDGFMLQAGGFTPDMRQKATRPPIKNEAIASRRNDRGTLAMARTSQVDSATSQFFINLVDNTALNHRDKTPAGFGYCAFGRVTGGMDVADRIAKVKTGRAGPHADVPVEPVVIKSIRRAE